MWTIVYRTFNIGAYKDKMEYNDHFNPYGAYELIARRYYID